ncbi:MAG: MarR family transcriptional regulator [Thermoplasmata archaeon]|nr:MarR family transcriptional regulator [Thermoplasmata archaeon]
MQATIPEEAQEDNGLVESYISPHGIDVEDAKIIRFTYNNPRSMPTICTILGIPIAECHRRIKKLMSLALIKRFQVSSSLSTSNSRGKVFYSANREKVEISTVDNRTRVRLKKVSVPDGSIFQFA